MLALRIGRSLYLPLSIVYCMTSILRLEEKFLVHSLPDTAHNLRRLTESFLEAHLEQSFPRSDAHYGVLSLLFCLSQSPLHVTFKSSLPILPPSEEVEWFDWTRHLMEDIEFSPIQSSDSEVRWEGVWSRSRIPIELLSTCLNPVWCSSSVCFHRAVINLSQPSVVFIQCVSPQSYCQHYFNPVWCWSNVCP